MFVNRTKKSDDDAKATFDGPNLFLKHTYPYQLCTEFDALLIGDVTINQKVSFAHVIGLNIGNRF